MRSPLRRSSPSSPSSPSSYRGVSFHELKNTWTAYFDVKKNGRRKRINISGKKFASKREAAIAREGVIMEFIRKEKFNIPFLKSQRNFRPSTQTARAVSSQTSASPNQHVEPLSQNNDEEPVPPVESRQNSEPVPPVKPRQNSDSIESDSEGPDPAFVVKRPATRKKTADRLMASKMVPQQSPRHNKAGRGVTKKSFPDAAIGSSLAFTRKRCQRRSPGNIASTMATDGEVNPGEGQPLKTFNCREKQVQGNSSTEKPQVQGKASAVDDKLQQSRDGEFTAPERVAQEVDPQEDLEQADQNRDNDLPAFGVEVPKESDFPDSPAIKKRRPECRLSLSSPKDSDSETDEEGSRPRGLGRSRTTLPEIPAVKKSGFVPQQNKKLHCEERIKSSTIPPTFLSEKGSKLQPISDSNEGDARAISPLALDLERIKWQSPVRDKSAQILTSAAEGIQLQLQTAESQTKSDILKLSDINESKRKCVEVRYEAFGVEVPKESDFPDSPAIKKRRLLEESSPSSQHTANSGEEGSRPRGSKLQPISDSNEGGLLARATSKVALAWEWFTCKMQCL